MLDSLMAGIAGGVGANEGQRALDQSLEREHFSDKLHHKLCDIHDDIHLIAHHFKRMDEPPYDKRITLQTTRRVQLANFGRRYNMIFVPNNTTQISVNIPG